MKLENLIKKHLQEALGVPSNIVQTANTVFNQLLPHINDKESLDELVSNEISIRGDYNISDYHFSEILFKFDFYPMTDYHMEEFKTNVELAGVQVHSGRVKLEKNITLKQVDTGEPIFIVFKIIYKENVATIEDIKKFFIDQSVLIKSTLTHELKHTYDHSKSKQMNIKGRIRYNVFSSNTFGNIQPINKFFHQVYYISSIENLVRPSEIAAHIESGKISKKEFYNFLMNNRTYKDLKEIHEFSYEKLRQDLYTYIPQLKELYTKSGINDFDNLPDDQFIDKTLELVYVNIMNWSIRELYSILQPNPFHGFFSGIFGTKHPDEPSEDDVLYYANKFENHMMKYKENPKAFYIHQEQLFKRVSEKMIKKIAKLYAMARDNQNESIVNPELWYKYVVKEVKIERDFNLNINKRIP